MKKLLWLDDYRNPNENNWINFSPIGSDVDVNWVINYDEFVYWITKNGLPDAICFDHDLGEDKTGYDCAKWLVEYCQSISTCTPSYNIQSANPVGKENIDKLLSNFNSFIESELI